MYNLQIKDYINVLRLNGRWEPLKIHDIEMLMEFSKCNQNEVKPIKLTDEIIAFIKCPEFFLITASDVSPAYQVSIKDDVDLPIYFNYLHEIQNVFRSIFKYELEIDDAIEGNHTRIEISKSTGDFVNDYNDDYIDENDCD